MDGLTGAREYATWAEASVAITSTLDRTDGTWELVRTSDDPDAWISVLSGIGRPETAARLVPIQHYPPRH